MNKRGKRKIRSYEDIEDLEDENELDSNDNQVNDISYNDDEDDDLFNEDLEDESDRFSESSVPMEKHEELLRDLTNFEKFLKIKINGWLGLTWKDGKYVKDPNNDPIMNKKCADWCIDYLRTYTRDNNIVTNMTNKQFSFIDVDIIDVLWLNIGLRMQEFQIKNHGDVLRICTELEHAAQLAIMGAEDGRYSKLLTGTYGLQQSGKINHDINTKKKTGGLDMLKKIFS